MRSTKRWRCCPVSGFEYHGGLANHGPMAAEALVVLGRPDAVRGVGRGLSPATPGPRLSPRTARSGAWRDALGDFRRVSDWAQMLERELLGRSLARGARSLERTSRARDGRRGPARALRTGHAARSLVVRDSPARRRELAEGLAYWAARYQALPETRGRMGADRPSGALARVERLPLEQRARPGLIADGLRALDGLPRSWARPTWPTRRATPRTSWPT